MKHLSEKIRDGSKKHPQIYDRYFLHYPNGDIAATCALGAAMVDDKYNGDISLYLGSISALYRLSIDCPACGLRYDHYSPPLLIPHLNDFHRWSREAIAEWLEVEERKAGLWDDEKQEKVSETSDSIKEPEEHSSRVLPVSSPSLTKARI